MLLINARASIIKDSSGKATTRMQLDGIQDDCFLLAIKESVCFLEKFKYTKLNIQGKVVYLNLSSASKRLGVSKDVIRAHCKNGTFAEFAHSQIGKIPQYLIPLSQSLKISEILQIIEFVKKNQQSWEDSETDHFIHKSKEVPRSVEYNHKTNRIYIHLNRSCKNDPILGKGASKTIKTSVEFDTGKSLARFSVFTAFQPKETVFVGLFGDHTTGVIKTHQITKYRGKRLDKIGVIQELGSSLSSSLKTRPFTLREKDSLAIQLLEGLVNIHEKGVIHRDIKPQNIILIEEDGNLKTRITDFGISCHVNSLVEEINGAPKYMSQDAYSLRPTFKVDVYAMGVTLLELYANNREDYTNQESVQYNQRLLNLIKRMTDDNPRNRPTAQEALEMLRKLSEE